MCAACMVRSVTAFQQSSAAFPLETAAPPFGAAAIAEPVMFGDYLLEQELAHGGMGVVYRARQLSLNRTVAVKLLLLGKYSSTRSLQRFRREAQSAALLQHPGIVAVHEVGETDGQPFIAMEYVPGGSLADRLREHPLPPREAAEIIRAVAEALHFAHGQGLQHRDVKPSNLLFDAHGHVRITDFGLAKKLDGSGDLTLTGNLVGTPNYLPPEAARAVGEIDGVRGDVWSLGAVLYECLTGRPPFLAESLQQTLRRIAESDPVPLRTLNREVPADLETICLKALAKAPAQRLASAKDFADELGRWLAGEPILTRPASPPERLVKWVRRRPKIAALGALALGAIAAALTILAVANRKIAAERERAEARSEESRQRLMQMHVAAGTRIIKDGAAFDALLHFTEALALGENGATATMHRRRIGAVLGASPRLLAQREVGGVGAAAFSPDGSRVISGDGAGGIAVWDAADGHTLQKLDAESGTMTLGFFDPRGQVFSVDRAGRLLRWDSAGRAAGDPLPVHVATTRRYEFRDCLDFSPDGQWLAAFVPGGGAQVFRAEDGVARGPVHAAGRTLLRVRLAADARTLAVCGDGIGAQLLDVESGVPLWQVTPVESVVRLVLFSADGQLLATTNGGQLDLWDIATRQRLCATVTLPRVIYECRFHPDGRAITASTSGGLVTLDTATGRAVGHAMEHLSHVTNFTQSPDGHLAAAGGYDGLARVWDVRTGEPATPWLPAGHRACHATLSPDARRVLTVSEGILRLWELAPDRSEIPRFPHRSLLRAMLTPDGRGLLLAGGTAARLHDVASGRGVWSADLAGECRAACLSRDGRVVAIATRDSRLHFLDAASGENLAPPRTLPSAPAELALSSDGSRVLVMNTTGETLLVSREAGVSPIALPAIGSNLGADGGGVTFSPDGRYAAGFGGSAVVWIWDTQAGATTFWQADVPISRPGRIRFSADSRRALIRSAESESIFAQIDPATGREIGPRVSNPGLFAAEYTSDSRRIMAGVGELAVVLLDAVTAQPVTPVISFDRPIFTALPSPDGRLLAVVDDTSTVHIREAATGEMVAPPAHAGGQVRELAWSPDGNALLYATHRGAGLLNIAPASGDLATLRRQSELISTRQLDASLHLNPLSREQIMERWQAQEAESAP